MPNKEMVERVAQALLREDPLPMSMFTKDDLCDLATAALIACQYDEMVTFLRHFAKVAEWIDGHRGHVFADDGELWAARSNIPGDDPPSITVGDVRRVRRFLADLDGAE